jgi:phospholipase C
MTNEGTSAVHYSIAANRFRTDGPWQYDVGPGASLEDYFSVQTYGAGHYDLTAYGPNGFTRHFTGNINVGCDELEVSAALHPMDGTIELVYVNRGTSAVTYTTRATRYRTDGPWTTRVPAGGMQIQTFDVGAMGQGWYSLHVTVDSDAEFSRAFVGHLENGRASTTGI